MNKFCEPEILDPNNAKDLGRIKTLQKKADVVDDLTEEEDELRMVNNPKEITHAALFEKKEKKKGKVSEGTWVYFPWKNSLVHILKKADFEKLRLSRNLNLIFSDEQKKLNDLKIGIAGLNVGNPAAICLALESSPALFKFADFDGLSLSNLNRFRAGVCELGINKAILSARQVYEIDPYAKIELFENGLTPDNLEKFLMEPRIDVLVEEMDNLKLKIEIRKLAQKHKIPVVMVTGNGENVIIDIERFDLDPELPFLNGYLKNNLIDKIYSLNPKEMKVNDFASIARDFMGDPNLTQRLKDSFSKVGVDLASIPQLAESSFLRGAVVTHAIRQIMTSENEIRSGRYYLELDKLY